MAVSFTCPNCGTVNIAEAPTASATRQFSEVQQVTVRCTKCGQDFTVAVPVERKP